MALAHIQRGFQTFSQSEIYSSRATRTRLLRSHVGLTDWLAPRVRGETSHGANIRSVETFGGLR